MMTTKIEYKIDIRQGIHGRKWICVNGTRGIEFAMILAQKPYYVNNSTSVRIRRITEEIIYQQAKKK